MKPRLIAITAGMLLVAIPAYAGIFPKNVYIVDEKLISCWTVVISLVCELFFIRYFFKLSLLKSLIADFAMNLASTMLDFLTVQVAFYLIVADKFPWLSACNAHTISTLLFFVTFNAGVEALVIHRYFYKNAWRRVWGVLIIANAVSVVGALVVNGVSTIRL